MPKITSVEPQQRNPKRFNIFLDGKFAFGADADLVVNRRLVVGKIIAPQDLEKILFETEVGKLMERMYRLFSLRARSEQEVRNYLRQLSFKRKTKGQEEISGIAVDMLINNLKNKAMLNDLEFARSWVESRKKKKGKRLIKQELIQKGINKEIIEEILNDSNHLNRVDEQKVAENLIEKKMKIWKNLSSLEFKKKAYDFLMRRGFDWEIVRYVIENILKKV